MLSFTQFLDNLYTTTWQNRRDGVADNVFDATPFWFWLKKNGKLSQVSGGRFIEQNLEYAKNSNIKWIGKGGTVVLNDYEFLTIAQFQWRYLTASIVRFGVDDQQNRGKSRVINLMNSKMTNTENSLIDVMEGRLVAGSGQTVAGEPAIDGLQCLVADDPTANSGGAGIAVGGIDSSQAQYAWWRNKSDNMTGVSFATEGINRMRTMLNNVSQNRTQDRTDILLSDQTTYERYEDAVLAFYRTENRSLADAGFQNQTFKGIPMVWAPKVSQRLYFLNTRFLEFVYDPVMYFDMTEWKPIPDQVNDRAAQIITACNLVTNRRRVQGVMYGMDTP
jgi:hypothetical protein